MKGINGKPSIAVDEHIDIDGLVKLEKEICYGIAQSNVQTGIYGPGILESRKYGNYLKLSYSYAKSQMSDRERAVYSGLNRNQRGLFFKLYEGLYSASTVVYIRDFKEKGVTSYLGKGLESATDFTDDAKFFPRLIEWVYSLPFEEIGRIIFFMHEHDCKLLTHCDGTKYTPHNNEFLWLNPCGQKHFFIYDEENEIEHPVQGKAIFFNDLDHHGGHPVSKMTWSLRVDGKFTQEFREKIGIAGLDHY
jgi:hypothetical protein